MLFVKQQKTKTIYEDISDVCKKIEYITKLNADGRCHQEEAVFDAKICSEHAEMLADLANRIEASNEEGCLYGAELAKEIEELYTAYRAGAAQLNDAIIANAQISRLSLSTIAILKDFNASKNHAADYLAIIKNEKANVNRTMSFLAGAGAGQNDAYEAYSRYSDAINKYINYLEDDEEQLVQSDIPDEDPEDTEVNIDDIEVEISYKEAKKIADLTEKIRFLERELMLKKANEEKLLSAIETKAKEAYGAAARAEKAEKERSALITDIESVKRTAASESRLKINLPLINVSSPLDDNVWTDNNNEKGHVIGVLQKIISKKPQTQPQKKAESGIQITAYQCEVVQSASNIIPEGECAFLKGFSVYRDTSGRHYFTQTTTGSRTHGGIVLDINAGPLDIRLLTHRFSDDEFREFICNHPSVCRIMPEFYSFMTSVIKICICDGLADTSTNAIVTFNMYYLHLFMIIREYMSEKNELCIKALMLASELLAVSKYCCENIIDEAAFVNDIADKLISGKKEAVMSSSQVSEMFGSNPETSAYLCNLNERIASFPDIETNETEAGDVDNTMHPDPEMDDNEMLLMKKTAETKQTKQAAEFTATVEKYKRMTAVPDFNSVRYIVSKADTSGCEDISTYAVENIDSAVGQYCFAIAPTKKIGVSITGNRYYLLQAEAGENSQLLLTERDKKFIREDGVLDLVEFYEFKLLVAVKAAENE